MWAKPPGMRQIVSGTEQQPSLGSGTTLSGCLRNEPPGMAYKGGGMAAILSRHVPLQGFCVLGQLAANCANLHSKSAEQICTANLQSKSAQQICTANRQGGISGIR